MYYKRLYNILCSLEICPDGGMVDTLVLEASALCVRVRVSLGAPRIMRLWWNGIHSRLKICRLRD